MKRLIKKFLLTFVIIITTMILLGEVFIPKSVEGAFSDSLRVRGFYQESRNSLDLVFVGSSHSYTSISPKVISEEFNMSSYNFATAEQPLEASYFYIKEIISHQKPKYIVLETYMTDLYPEYREVNIRKAIDNLPPSVNKIMMISEIVPPTERIYYYFPILKYHNRWDELNIKDYDMKYKKIPHNFKGQVSLEGNPIDYFDNESYRIDNRYQISEKDIFYLDSIISLLKDSETNLILYTAPYSLTDSEFSKNYKIEEYARSKNIKYINFESKLEDLDFNEDFYDSSHLSSTGANKVTIEFMKELLKFK